MSCFSLGSLESILIWIIIIGAIFAIIKIVVPMVAAALGGPGSALISIINIVLWAALCIVVVIFAFQMISCLLSAGGGLHIGR
jgi:hypothetical protein